jgi:hypothetical protein
MYSEGASRQFSNFSHPAGGVRAMALEQQIEKAAKKPSRMAGEGMGFLKQKSSPPERSERIYWERNVTKL